MRQKLLICLTVLFMVILVACGNENAVTSEEPSQDINETSNEDDKVLTIALGNDIIGFDIHNHQNTSTEAVHVNMFNYLVKKDENMEIQPDLLESYENVDDTTWEMTLKEGVKFHNGDDLTSEDVKFTLERVAQDEALLEHNAFRTIKEVEIVDKLTFNIITDEPDPSLLYRLSKIGAGMLPKNYIEDNGWDHFMNNPVGTGPYKYVEWVRDDRIVLEPFENYFEGKVDEWEKVVFRVIPESSTRVSELLTGGVDIAVHVPPSDWDRVDANEGTSIEKAPTIRTVMLVVRHTDGYPTANPKVREAIDLAIDNKAITEHVLKGGGTPTRSLISPGEFGYNEEYHDTYLHDVERAKELLAEADYADGFEMTIHVPSGRYLQDKEIGEAIAGMLSEIGIKVNLEVMEWSNFTDMRRANENKDAYMLGLGSSMFDTDHYANTLWHSEVVKGHTDYSNEEVDQLIEQGATNMDPDERLEQYHRLIELIAQDNALIFLHDETSNYGVADNVNFTPTLDELFHVSEIKKAK